MSASFLNSFHLSIYFFFFLLFFHDRGFYMIRTSFMKELMLSSILQYFLIKVNIDSKQFDCLLRFLNWPFWDTLHYKMKIDFKILRKYCRKYCENNSSP